MMRDVHWKTDNDFHMLSKCFVFKIKEIKTKKLNYYDIPATCFDIISKEEYKPKYLYVIMENVSMVSI